MGKKETIDVQQLYKETVQAFMESDPDEFLRMKELYDKLLAQINFVANEIRKGNNFDSANLQSVLQNHVSILESVVFPFSITHQAMTIAYLANLSRNYKLVNIERDLSNYDEKSPN